MLEIQSSIKNNISTIYLKGSLDIGGVDKLEEQVERIQLKGIDVIQVDLQNVDFVDSTGIGSLLHMKRSMEGQGKEYKIINVSEDMREVFAIIGIDDLLF